MCNAEMHFPVRRNSARSVVLLLRELYTAPRPKRGITSPSPIRENPVLTCRRASKKQKNRWLIVMAGSAFFTLLSVIMVCVTYEPESFISRARINWPMIIIGIFSSLML